MIAKLDLERNQGRLILACIAGANGTRRSATCAPLVAVRSKKLTGKFQRVIFVFIVDT